MLVAWRAPMRRQRPLPGRYYDKPTLVNPPDLRGGEWPGGPDRVAMTQETRPPSRPRHTPPRTPTETQKFWARRTGSAAVLLIVLGVIVGGSASAVFFVAAVLPGMITAWLLRGTLPPGGGGAGP